MTVRLLGETTLDKVGGEAEIADFSDALLEQMQADEPNYYESMPHQWHETISKGEYSAEHLGEFVRTAFAWRSVQAERGGNKTRLEYSDILSRLRYVPQDKLQAVYDDPASGGAELRAMIDHSIETGWLRLSLDFYKTLHGEADSLRLADPRSEAWKDPLIRKLYGKKKTTDLLLDEFRSTLGLDEYDFKSHNDPETRNRAQHSYARRFLRDIVRMPAKRRSELMFAADSRIHDREDPKDIDNDSLSTMLELTAKNTRALGNRALQRLRKQAGIINLDYRSAEDLKLMHNLIRGDKATIEHLQKGDVTVVFTDETGDHNGAFKEMTNRHATPGGRTLSFGISKPADIYRHMILLKKLGIKPSTIAIGAHGEPGTMLIGDVKVTNSDLHKNSKNSRVLSLSLAKGLPRIFSEFMQNSKGIDEPEDLKGHRRIILNSCSQAAPAHATRLTYQKDPNGKESNRLERWGGVNESTADTLARKNETPNLILYSSTEPMSSKTTQDGIGIEFYFRDPGTKKLSIPGKVTVHSRGKNGEVITGHATSIPVRKTPMPEKKAA